MLDKVSEQPTQLYSLAVHSGILNVPTACPAPVPELVEGRGPREPAPLSAVEGPAEGFKPVTFQRTMSYAESPLACGDAMPIPSPLPLDEFERAIQADPDALGVFYF